MKSIAQFSILVATCLALSGCAVYYRDAESGAEHIWGLGHLAMKVTPPLDGKKAIIRKATLMGLALGIDEGSLGFSVGWDQRERIVIHDENTAITIERPPSNDFFYFKIRTYPLEGDGTENENNHSLNREDVQP